MAGDALNAEDVASALQGMDAVIYALGIKESLAMLWQEVTLFSSSMEILLQQMAASGPRRLLVVTGFGAGRSKSAMSRPPQLMAAKLCLSLKHRQVQVIKTVPAPRGTSHSPAGQRA